MSDTEERQLFRRKQAPIAHENYKTGHWDNEEIEKLRNIIDGFQNKKSRIHWGEVIASMNRSRKDVEVQYNRLRRGKMKTDPYTPEEDKLILQRVAEHRNSSKKNGFWKALEDEMNRSTWSLGHRWTSVLSKLSNVSSDNIEPVDSSSDAPLHVFGATVNDATKKRRWMDAQPDTAVTFRTGTWSQEEVDQLMEFVAYQSVAYEEDKTPNKRPFKINWHLISQQTGREKNVCANKHKSVMRRQLKKTEFTPEEDVIIAMRLKEWGGSGHGMWAAIARELGRDGVLCQVYWTQKQDSEKQNLEDSVIVDGGIKPPVVSKMTTKSSSSSGYDGSVSGSSSVAMKNARKGLAATRLVMSNDSSDDDDSV